MIVTSGVMQGLSLVTATLTHPGETVLVEQPTYLGMLHVLSSYGAHAVGVPVDDGGVQFDALEAAIRQHRPRFFYTMPAFQNPTGVCLAPERRAGLLALAEQYDLYLIEDDIYGTLAYDSRPEPALRSLDPDGARIIYLSSLSKVLTPGLRIGYMVVPPHLREAILYRRQAMDLSGPPLLQRAAAHFLHRGRFRPHMERVTPKYRERRDELLRVMAQRMPAFARWTKPHGGFSCWVTIPAGCAPPDLHHRALMHGIAFTPGEAFMVEPDGQTHLRLCFGGLSPELIREAVTILGRLLEPGALRSPVRLRAGVEERPVV